MGLSGTGPKAGGEDYLFAFLKTRAGWRLSPAPDGDAAVPDWPAVRPWSDDLEQRRRRLQHAARALATGQSGAAPSGFVTAFAAALERAGEIGEPTPTIPLPGQDTVVDWSMPRGAGLIIVDESALPSSLGYLASSLLLAGNGAVLAVPPVLQRAAVALLTAAHRAGVPATALAVLPAGQLPVDVPPGRFDFLAADVSLARATSLAAALTQRHPGQRGIPAFLSVTDAPAPGESGFLRRFTIPRTIAVRTLRHGADLGR
jgi:hypothetical protein